MTLEPLVDDFERVDNQHIVDILLQTDLLWWSNSMLVVWHSGYSALASINELIYVRPG